MTLDQRRALSGRAETQALLGERVHVVAVSGKWARIVVPDQPTPVDPRGYPGWVPTAQLVVDTAPPTGTTVTLTAKTTWLRAMDGRPLMEVSFGTTLKALALSGQDWQVRLPDGRRAEVVASSVIAGSRPTTARALVSTARELLGLDYLWAGASGFGFDCSGLTAAVYRLHDMVIPRDADAQAAAGRPVARSAVQPGDLVFFARDGHVHHVGMYVGNGMMLHAPRTGTQVQVTSLSVAPYVNEYSGARRFLP